MSRQARRGKPAGRPPKQAAPAAGYFSRLVACGIGVIAALAIIAVPVLAIYFVVGMVPSAVAAVIDRRRPRYFAHTVTGLNVIGLWPYVVGAWKGSIAGPDMWRQLVDPTVWLVVYGAAGLGWLLFFATPVLAEIFLEIREDGERGRIESRIAALKEEWGPEVAAGAAAPDKG
jgi:hypothetical protein